MDIRQLRYFLEIAREGQITRAAKRLHMEQPPLSRQLKQMEKELGVTLFDRSGKQLELTRAGELLRQKAESLLQQFHESLNEVKELDEGVRGTLAIGAVVSCVSLLPPKIKLFHERYPNVTFHIREGDHFLLGDLLHHRNIELVVTRLPFESVPAPKAYEIMPLPSDPFVAVVPRPWLATAKLGTGSVTLRQLADCPFLTLKTDKTTGMHERVLEQFRQSGAEPRVLCECSSVAIAVALVAAGIGMTILPKSVMASFPHPDIATVAIADTVFKSEVGIVWLKDRYLSKSARHFISMFR
ncbi:LysR family transcriptional regulator [Cohnella laeviribosi]|uniref:LysR family transcriptional regulator n=1 Tax=Cohnella laeviribosi TaxID=380174 RepID=UPI0003658374|nr:LysR family transcriptional regulator [Cohnella laeviribosi]